METIHFEQPAAPKHITLLALNLRMTKTERAAIRAAQSTNSDVNDLFYLFGIARYINLNDQMVIDGMNFLESLLLLGTGRASIIISGPVEDKERA